MSGKLCVCVCVCACVSERERERELATDLLFVLSSLPCCLPEYRQVVAETILCRK